MACAVCVYRTAQCAPLGCIFTFESKPGSSAMSCLLCASAGSLRWQTASLIQVGKGTAALFLFSHSYKCCGSFWSSGGISI